MTTEQNKVVKIKLLFNGDHFYGLDNKLYWVSPERVTSSVFEKVVAELVFHQDITWKPVVITIISFTIQPSPNI